MCIRFILFSFRRSAFIRVSTSKYLYKSPPVRLIYHTRKTNKIFFVSARFSRVSVITCSWTKWSIICNSTVNHLLATVARWHCLMKFKYSWCKCGRHEAALNIAALPDASASCSVSYPLLFTSFFFFSLTRVEKSVPTVRNVYFDTNPRIAPCFNINVHFNNFRHKRFGYARTIFLFSYSVI